MSDQEINITSGRELEAWLEANAGNHLDDRSRVIAFRAALRVWPMVFTVNDVPDEKLSAERKQGLILQSWRAMFISSVATVGPTDEMRRAARANAADNADNAASAAAYAAFAAAFAAANAAFAAANAANAANAAAADAAFAAAFAADNAADNADNAAFAARAPATAARAPATDNAAFAAANAAFAAATAIWEAVGADCAILAAAAPREAHAALLNTPLWPMDVREDEHHLANIPPWIRGPLDTFAQDDANGRAWQLMVEWYRMLTGNTATKVFETARSEELALQENEFWEISGERSADDIMAEVAKTLGWPDQLLGQSSIDPQTEEVDVPPTQPATIEPEWVDGKLSQPSRALGDDFDAGEMDAALLALKQLLEEFASGLDEITNLDERFAKMFWQIAEQAPTQMPSQDKFFMFAHNELVLQGYVATAQAEWDGVSSARFAALAIQFSQTVEKSPAWREFKRKHPTDSLEPNDVDTVETVAADIAAELLSEMAANFVDAAIPAQLVAMANEVPEVYSPSSDERLVTPDIESRSFDILESANNILKRIVGAALWVKAGLSNAASALWAPIGEGIAESYPEEGKRFGKLIVKTAFRLLKYGPLAYLISRFPDMFGWLQAAIKFFQ